MSLRNFSFVIDGLLAGSAHPAYAVATGEELRNHLSEHGVGAIVSLDERGLPPDWIEKSALPHLHIRIPDFHPPSMDQIDEFVRFVDENRGEGRATLVHCHAGMGRTGTMIACYLIREEGLEPGEAINRVRRLRPGSVETYSQEDAIYAYYRKLKAEEGGRDAGGASASGA